MECHEKKVLFRYGQFPAHVVFGFGNSTTGSIGTEGCYLECGTVGRGEGLDPPLAPVGCRYGEAHQGALEDKAPLRFCLITVQRAP